MFCSTALISDVYLGALVDRRALRRIVRQLEALNADLQLSGHVHPGQIIPFNLLVRLVYHRPTGLSALPGGGQLYVSRGTGTWGPPMCVLAPPEITLFELSGTGPAR